jgi:hypothetical protein
MAQKKLTDEEMAELKVKRAEAQAKKIKDQEFLGYFPGFEDNKTALRRLTDDIRNFRKTKLLEGIHHVELPQGLKAPFYLALDRLDYNTYRPEIGILLIEGLKIQDREIKVASYHYLDNLFTKIGQVDFGWVSQMLARKYVSRYGWMLMRKHATEGSHLLLYGGVILGDLLDMWANGEIYDVNSKEVKQNPELLEENKRKNAELKEKAWNDWKRLSSEDGKPIDIREILPRR